MEIKNCDVLTEFKFYEMWIFLLKFIYRYECIADVWARKVLNKTDVSKSFLYKESKNWSTYFHIEKFVKLRSKRLKTWLCI